MDLTTKRGVSDLTRVRRFVMRSNRWALTGSVTALCLLLVGAGWWTGRMYIWPATASAPSTSVPLFPAPTPKVGNPPPGGQLPALPGPYVSQAAADQSAQSAATQMGSGATRLVSSTIETVAQASASVGVKASSWVGDFVNPDRMVWLIWLQGPYRIFSCPQAPCAAWSSRYYYDVIDATTGTLDVTGSDPTGSLPSPSP
jgi:hypothetical protein